MTDRLRTILDDFQSVPPAMRLELLLDFARRFPPLPEHYRSIREQGAGRVPECQAEVYLFAEVADGRVRLHADIPEHAPTQRALVGLIMDAYDGAAPEEVAALPDELLHRLGIAALLGMQRQQGFAGVLRRVKASVAEAAS